MSETDGKNSELYSTDRNDNARCCFEGTRSSLYHHWNFVCVRVLGGLKLGD